MAYIYIYLVGLEARKALINFGAYGDFQYVVETVKKIRKPKPWMHPESITRAQLAKIRDEFWDTAPYYGGRKGNIYHSNIHSGFFFGSELLNAMQWMNLFSMLKL